MPCINQDEMTYSIRAVSRTCGSLPLTYSSDRYPSKLIALREARRTLTGLLSDIQSAIDFKLDEDELDGERL